MLVAGLSFIFSKFVVPHYNILSHTNPIKEITVIVNSAQYSPTTTAIMKSGFKKVHLITTEKVTETSLLYNTIRSMSGPISNLVNVINTTYILFGHNLSFYVPPSYPKLPNKPQLIGYSFDTCNRGKYTVNLPNMLGGSIITKEAFVRFIEFYKDTLHSKYDYDQAFQIFTDLHTLRLLKLPCGKPVPLPKWELIEPVDEPRGQVEPWGEMELIPEVWLIKNLI